MSITIKSHFVNRRGNAAQQSSSSMFKWLAPAASLPVVLSMCAALSGPPAFAASSPTPTPAATPAPTYSGLLLYNAVSSPITVAAGATAHSVASVTGKSPAGAAYGVIARATVFVQGGATDTTCLVKLAGGAVWGTPITVPAHTTVSIPFEDTSPGFPGEQYNLGIAIQAGAGGGLTILPPTSLTIESVASQPNNNAY
jgi:hypothetical protein